MNEKEFRNISKEYRKCFQKKCRTEQKQINILQAEHQTFMKILNRLVDNNTITRDEFWRLLKANADRIGSDPVQISFIDCKLNQCYDLYYKYIMADIQVALQKDDISPQFRNTLETYYNKFKKHKITTQDLISYSRDLYNNM
jgi:hypothetical protein